MRLIRPLSLELTLELTLALACMLFLAPLPASAFDLTVAHVNDTHSYLDASGETLSPGGEKTYVRLGGWARLTTAVNQLRASRKNVALLHAGDAVQGGLYFLMYAGKPEIEGMNRLGFDAMTLGNHDFDNGGAFLEGMLAPAKFPILSANLDRDAAAGQYPALAERVKPYTVLTYGKQQVGVIGLTTEETPLISVGGNEMRFLDAVRTARQYTRELERKGVKIIILLSHLGYEQDKLLATKVPGLDLIVGGHSHTLLGNRRALDELGLKPAGPYPTVVRGPFGNDVYVVTAWRWGRMLPWMDLSFDDTGRIIRARGQAPLLLADSFQRKNDKGEKTELTGETREQLLALLDANPAAQVTVPDADAEAFLKPYADGLAELQHEVIATATAPLPHVRMPDDEYPSGSLLAPLVADSMLWITSRTSQAADLALLNAGGVRDSLTDGPITVGDVLSLMPFYNTLYVLHLPGSRVAQALEYGVSHGDGAFPYVAGARYTADLTRPKGQRLLSVELAGTDGSWQPLEPNKTYRMVTNGFLAHGGDGYDLLPKAQSADKGKDNVTGDDTGLVDTQVFMDYLREKKELSVPAETGVSVIR